MTSLLVFHSQIERKREKIVFPDTHAQHSDSLQNHQLPAINRLILLGYANGFSLPFYVASITTTSAFTATGVQVIPFDMSESQVVGHTLNLIPAHLSQWCGFCCFNIWLTLTY